MYIVFPYELSLRDYYISFHLKEFRQKSLSKVFCASCLKFLARAVAPLRGREGSSLVVPLRG